MRNRRLYTFVVANHAVSKVWRLSVPFPVLVALGIFALIGIMASAAAGFHYGKMALKVMDYEHILAENDAFRAENHSYRIQTAQLGEKIDFLETVSRKLMLLSGMTGQGGLGGVGGSSKDSLSHPRPASAGTLQSVDGYIRRVDSLESQLREVRNVVAEKAMIEAARPGIPPVNGYVNQGFGRRPDPFNPSFTEYHPGLDISAPYGARIIAPADGTVTFAGAREGYGIMIVLDHKFGITTRYGHLSKLNVKAGQRVSRYDVVGFVGNSGRSTGAHLHFEIWRHNSPVNPIEYIYPEERANKGRTATQSAKR